MGNPNPPGNGFNKNPQNIKKDNKGRPPTGESYHELFKEMGNYTESELNLIIANEAYPIKYKNVARALQRSLKNDRSFELAMDRTEGKPVQRIENKNDELTVRITNPDYDNV
jgi:adenine-specific DNA glycosylase